ncbi:hypothetical protein K2Q16_00875 [Patescibacteria group bacterium]|nr:hypothetical protein [Patescibacteria group bacterium]
MQNFKGNKSWAIAAGSTALVTILLVAWLLVPPPTSPTDVAQTATSSDQVSPTAPQAPWQTMTIIGSSVAGRPIEAHTYGNGSTSLLFVGGIHGGYEWNSVLLAYEFMDHLANFPETVPPSLTIHVIPSLNPDGLSKVVTKTGRFTLTDVINPAERVAAARFNDNQVDLNRNFDCKWQPTSTWRNVEVSAGSAPFSEPEAVALRDYVQKIAPKGAIFWHSQANTVYGSECENGMIPHTLTLMNTYAAAAGYRTMAQFNDYPVTGDAEGWLASIGVPAITVELKGYQTSEWSQNLAGTNAVLDLYR